MYWWISIVWSWRIIFPVSIYGAFDGSSGSIFPTFIHPFNIHFCPSRHNILYRWLCIIVPLLVYTILITFYHYFPLLYQSLLITLNNYESLSTTINHYWSLWTTMNHDCPGQSPSAKVMTPTLAWRRSSTAPHRAQVEQPWRWSGMRCWMLCLESRPAVMASYY